jgi:hypothetical protein
MPERAIFLLRDDATVEQLIELAALWNVQSKTLGSDYYDIALAKSACIAAALILREHDRRLPKAVSLELDADVAAELATDLRLRSCDGVLAAFWFSKKLQQRVAFMVLTCNRIKNVLNGINSAERYSMLHAKAAKRQIKRESVLGSLDLSAERAAAEQERDEVMALVRAEVQAALL